MPRTGTVDRASGSYRQHAPLQVIGIIWSEHTAIVLKSNKQILKYNQVDERFFDPSTPVVQGIELGLGIRDAEGLYLGGCVDDGIRYSYLPLRSAPQPVACICIALGLHSRWAEVRIHLSRLRAVRRT
jgi:hypothetical protein